MNNKFFLFCLLFMVIIFFSFPAFANESLAVYGLKGYGYTYSPIPSRGFYAQTGAIYSNYSEGDIWQVPFSITYGDGSWWEIAAASHWESWTNDDFNVDENGLGDIFLGAKIRFLGQDYNMPLDVAVMPFILIPTGDRDKFIGDLYTFNPSSENDMSYGLFLLLGRRWERLYFAVNIGFTYASTDFDYIDDTSLFIGLAAEYQISESFTSYIEFFHNGNKFDFPCSPCYDVYNDEDYQEIAGGIVWVKNNWGFKIHAGFGLNDTSPDYRLMGLINLNLF